jgi:Centromere/kinetochore Zw10
VLLAYETLQESLAGSEEAAVQLCNSAHSMLELYADIIPTYHQEKITLLPLLAGIFLFAFY